MQLPLPENEAGRVEALRSYRVLDTPPEERFDDLARLAAYVCGTPIGLVGLIDSTRKWFKSRVGWNVSEIPRDVSFGTHTILQHDVLIISDTLNDKRFARNQLATRAGVRFYAGAPLLTPEGYALGTLCVMDYVPRALTEGQRQMLRTLARQVMAHLEDQRGLGSSPGTEPYERYRRFFESGVVGFYRTTLDGQMLDCNPAFVRIMGYGSREELLACHASEFYFSPTDRQDFVEQCRSLGSLTNFESRLRRKDGSAVWVLDNVKPLMGRDGAPAMIESTLVDISDRKSTDQVLRESQERLLGIIGSAMDGIITVDGNQRIVVFNHAAEELFRCPASEAIGQALDKFIPQRFREAHQQYVQDFGRTGVSSRSMYSPGTQWGVRSNGEEFPIEATISQTKTANETLCTVILRDIGVRKRLEDDLRQVQKIEAVGQLAGGMAHEFNNYLGIVLGYSDLLLEEAGASEGLRRNVAEIKAATQRTASLTRQLLALSRRQVPEPKVLDVNAVVWETHKLLRRLIPENIDLVPVLEPNLPPVKVDPAQIHQILINLVVNARDAMPQGGKVVIETANAELDEEYAGRHIEVQPGRYVMLAVSDNGSGIDEQTQARIFEPFFTTKQADKGTGLGLSTVYGIVRQSGGHITVESALREGTKFRIYLPPAAVTELKVEDETPPMQTEVPTGTETLLVVEDEPALRRLISVSLEKRGYTVLAAEDGTEAIRILENNPGQVDLVISDIMMPKLNGLELRKKAIMLRPEMRFLFISGYAEDTLGETTHLPQDAGYLEKPFLPIELARKVRALLNESDARRGSADKTA